MAHDYVHLWNNNGDTRDFERSAFNIRASYHGKSGTPGVSMWMIDGAIWFCEDMTRHSEIYADSARGRYIPQYFAESCKRELVTGVSAEDWEILESGPDHELYWETWDSVLDNARITDSRGNWTLYQDGDLFLVCDHVC